MHICARGRRQGALEKPKLLQFVLHLTVATYDVARAQPGRGQCGWSAAPRDAEPQAPRYQVTRTSSYRYKRRRVSGRVMRSIDSLILETISVPNARRARHRDIVILNLIILVSDFFL